MNHIANGAGEAFHSPVTRGRLCGKQYTVRVMAIATVLFALLLCMSPSLALTDDYFFPYQQFVRYYDESVSLAFNNVRAGDAAYLMRSTTGVAITLPTSTNNKTINLTLQNAKMHEAVQTLLATLELNNSFLVYDRDGRLTAVVALEKTVSLPPPESQSSEEGKNMLNNADLTAPEREALVREFRRWPEVPEKDRESIHARLRTIPPSKERDQLIDDYVRLVLGVPAADPEGIE